MPQEYEYIYYVGPGAKQTQLNNTTNQENYKHSSAQLCGDDPFAMIRLLQMSIFS